MFFQQKQKKKSPEATPCTPYSLRLALDMRPGLLVWDHRKADPGKILAEPGTGGAQASALGTTAKNSEADLLLQGLDLIGQRGLADEQIFGGPMIIQGIGDLHPAVDLL